jgi:hypothetical protein
LLGGRRRGEVTNNEYKKNHLLQGIKKMGVVPPSQSPSAGVAETAAAHGVPCWQYKLFAGG